jgi:hypothetical protein
VILLVLAAAVAMLLGTDVDTAMSALGVALLGLSLALYYVHRNP